MSAKKYKLNLLNLIFIIEISYLLKLFVCDIKKKKDYQELLNKFMRKFAFMHDNIQMI